MAASRSRLVTTLAALAGLAALVALAASLLYQAWGDSLTFDEEVYIPAGLAAVDAGIIDLESSNPPLPQLLGGVGVAVLDEGHPRPASWTRDRMAEVFPRDPDHLRRLTFDARIPIILLTLGLTALVGVWVSAWAGTWAGVLAMAMLAVEPTFAGHGHLVTQDMALTLGFVGALAAHWWWLRCRHDRWLVAVGAFLAIGLLSKASSALVLPLVAVGALVLTRGTWLTRLRATLLSIAIPAGVAWALLLLIYRGFSWVTPAPSGRSGRILSLVLPAPWVNGFVFQLRHAHRGQVSYLNGQLSLHGFPAYFAEALALKSTLGFLALAGLGLVLVLLRRRGGGEIWLYTWLPAALIVLTVTLGGLDLGVRYVLPVYPLLAVAAAVAVGARAAAAGPGVMRAAPSLAILFLALSAASSLGHFPLHIGYFNELAGSRPERYLSDSNVDWSQDAWRLRSWWEGEGRPPLNAAWGGALPLAYFGITAQDVNPGTDPVRGLTALSLSRVTIYGDLRPPLGSIQPTYRVLDGRTPVVRIGSSIDVYRLQGELLS